MTINTDTNDDAEFRRGWVEALDRAELALRRYRVESTDPDERYRIAYEDALEVIDRLREASR